MRCFNFLLLSMIAVAPQVIAKTHVDIYQANVPIEQDAGEANQQKALDAGFTQVLKKTTGEQKIPSSAAIDKAKADLDNYLQSYNISEDDGQSSMEVKFIPEKIQSLLQEAGLTLWPDMRKKVLVWMVDTQASTDNQIAWEQSGLALSEQLESHAKQAGVPIFYPVGDFQDVTSVSSSDIEGNFIQRLAKASVRYSADAVLVVSRQELEDEQVQLKWRLYDQKTDSLAQKAKLPQEGQATDSDDDAAFSEMMGAVSHYFASHSSEKKKNAPIVDTFVGHFDGVQKVRDIVDIQNHLKDFASVGSVQVSGLKGRSVELTVNLIEPKASFDQEVSLSAHFSPMAAPVEPVKVQGVDENTQAQDTTSDAENAAEPAVLGAEMANNEATVMEGKETQVHESAIYDEMESSWYQYKN